MCLTGFCFGRVGNVFQYLTLHAALNPTQFAQLQDDQPILPDPYSERFGLRADPFKAAERAHYFMSCAPPNHSPPEQTHIKKYMICKIAFTSIGFMHLMKMEPYRKVMGITLSEPDTTAGMALCIVACKRETKLKTWTIYFANSWTSIQK